MKTKRKTSNFSSSLLYKKLLIDGSKLIALENENFQAIMMSQFWKITELIIHRDKKVTNKLRVFFRFTSYLVTLNKYHGSLFVVKYLKASLLSIQRLIAGSPVSSLREIEPDLPLPRLANGLPAWIGSRDRRAIRAGSKSVIQFYLSMFALFRVIEAPCKAKLSTITGEFTGHLNFLEESLGFFSRFGKDLIKGSSKLFMRPAELLFLETSSPSNTISWKSWGLDAKIIRLNSGLWSAFNKWLELTDNQSLRAVLKNSISRGFQASSKVPRDPDLVGYLTNGQVTLTVNEFNRGYSSTFDDIIDSNGLWKFPSCEEAKYWTFYWDYPKELRLFKKWKPYFGESPLGRLAFKEEAAGKLRIFAMVDVWTQSIFKPLHDSLFKILKNIPNDATFDQDAAFERAVSKAKVSGHSYGYDLSSATDRLPIDLQEAILRGLIGNHLAALWRVILTERSYSIPEDNPYGIEETSVRYRVGQPMGALSSWAMLAICHHAIVQYAFHLIGGQGWTTDYEVLGDDIVIFSTPLARKYVELMTLFGVELNMAKSVVSHKKIPTVEFAKRTSFNGQDVSPISLKMFLSQDSFAGRIAIFDWCRRRFDKHFIFSNLKTIFKTVRWDDRPLKSNLIILGVFSTLVRKKEVPFVWMIRNWTQTMATLLRGKGKKISVSLALGWYHQVLKKVFWKKPLDAVRPKALFSSENSRTWYRVLVLDQIYRHSKFALTIDIDLVVNKILLTSKLLTWIECAGYLLLRRRIRPTVYIRNRVQKDLDKLTEIFYDNSLLTLDVDELLTVLEKVMTMKSIFDISEKLAPKKKGVVDNLRLLQIFDKLLNSGFKKKISHQRRFEILSQFVQPYIKVDLNDRELITPHFNFIRDYLPFDQTVWIQNLILRKIASNKLELASVAFTKLVRRKMPWEGWLSQYPEWYW